MLLNEPPTITTARVNHNDTTATITDLHQGHDSWNNVSKESQQQKHHQQQRQRQQLHWNSVLPRLRVLVTALTVVETASVQSDTSSSSWTLPLSSSRIQIQPLARTAASTHFADWIPFLEETMYIPWVTGPSTPLYDKSASPDSVLGLDGGFARWWHPPCDQTISVPLTVTTIFQAFNPGLKDTVALELYQRGVVDALAVDKEAMRPMSPIVKESPTGATTNEKSNNSRHNTRTSNRESRIISISDNDSHNDTPHRDRTNTTALFVGKPEIDDLKPQRFLDSWDVAMARFSVVVSS